MFSQAGAKLVSRRFLSSSSSSSSKAFRPRRRPSRQYRPIQPVAPFRPKGPPNPEFYEDHPEPVVPGEFHSGRDQLERDYGPDMATALRDRLRAKRLGGELPVEEYLRMADYLTAAPGSLEEMRGERRGMALDAWDGEDREKFLTTLDKLVEEERIKSLDLSQNEYNDDEDEDEVEVDPESKEGLRRRLEEEIRNLEEATDRNGEPIDHRQLAHGKWAEMVVRVDRVQKVQKGGTMVRFRALVVGGNTRGCAGFGVAKANSPQEATQAASRICKRNIFFVDRHAGSGLTRNLAGRHNSCKVMLLSVQPGFGLNGHPLVMDILLYFGITDCTAKTHGNRNQYNVVQATFKALLNHESIDETAAKRGIRLMNLERYKKLGV